MTELKIFCSVRAAIREGDPNYLITAGSWWAGLYPPGKFDPALPEAHLFTNVLLLKVVSVFSCLSCT
jgi:hypothetical protein